MMTAPDDPAPTFPAGKVLPVLSPPPGPLPGLKARLVPQDAGQTCKLTRDRARGVDQELAELVAT